MVRILGVMVILMGILAACGGGSVSAASSGCSGARCFITIEKSNQDENFSIDLTRISEDESFTVDISFTLEKGKLEVTYQNNAGETVTINLEAGDDLIMQETFDSTTRYITFDFDPSGTVENAVVNVRKAAN